MSSKEMSNKLFLFSWFDSKTVFFYNIFMGVKSLATAKTVPFLAIAREMTNNLSNEILL